MPRQKKGGSDQFVLRKVKFETDELLSEYESEESQNFGADRRDSDSQLSYNE